MKLGGQLLARAAFFSDVGTEYEVLWFPELVWTFWRKEPLASPGTEPRIIRPLAWSQQYNASCDVDVNVTRLY